MAIKRTEAVRNKLCQYEAHLDDFLCGTSMWGPGQIAAILSDIVALRTYLQKLDADDTEAFKAATRAAGGLKPGNMWGATGP